MKIEIELNEKESEILTEMCKVKDMSPESLLRHSFRFYQTFDVKIVNGQITNQDLQNLLNKDMPPKFKPE